MTQPTKTERRFLTAEWRHLAFLNFPIECEVLQPFVPKGTMLDTYKGMAYVSVVGFRFLNTRVCGVPIPGHRDFEEVNLRFYVRRFSGNDWRRGVVFVKEIVPKPAIAAVARAVYNEQYVALPMHHAIEFDGPASPTSVEYSWQCEDKWNHVRAARKGTALEPAAGSLEEFITEHYWGYVRARNGQTVEYRVEHPRWQVTPASGTLQCDVGKIYGAGFLSALSQPAKSAFIADGSAVTVFRGKRI